MNRAIGSLKEMSTRRTGSRRGGSSRNVGSSRKIGRFNEPEKMEDIFRSKRMKKYFKEFIQFNDSVESFLFFESILLYEKISRESWRKRAAEDMLNRFVRPGSELEANLSGDTRERLLALTHFHSRSFQDAKEEMADLMASNYMHEFLEKLAEEERVRGSLRTSINRARSIRQTLQMRRTKAGKRITSENPMFNNIPDYANVSPAPVPNSDARAEFRTVSHRSPAPHRASTPARAPKSDEESDSRSMKTRSHRVTSARKLSFWEKYFEENELEDERSAFSITGGEEVRKEIRQRVQQAARDHSSWQPSRASSQGSRASSQTSRSSSTTNSSRNTFDRFDSEWSVNSNASNIKARPPPKHQINSERLSVASVEV